MSAPTADDKEGAMPQSGVPTITVRGVTYDEGYLLVEYVKAALTSISIADGLAASLPPAALAEVAVTLADATIRRLRDEPTTPASGSTEAR